MPSDMAGFPGPVYDAETAAWAASIISRGGSVSERSKGVANLLMSRINASTFNSKLVYLLPFLGTGLAAVATPLRGILNFGVATNSGFVEADFDEFVGVQNPTESIKYLNARIRPDYPGAGSGNGGLGWWEVNWGAGTGVVPIGATSFNATDLRYVIDGRSNVQSFRWGVPANGAGDTNTFSNGHYYGQRSSASLRQLFKNGAPQGTDNTTTDGNAPSAETLDLWVMGWNRFSAGTPAPTYWKGTGAVAYLTDGTLTTTEAAALHAILRDYLITPMRRA